MKIGNCATSTLSHNNFLEIDPRQHANGNCLPAAFVLWKSSHDICSLDGGTLENNIVLARQEMAEGILVSLVVLVLHRPSTGICSIFSNHPLHYARDIVAQSIAVSLDLHSRTVSSEDVLHYIQNVTLVPGDEYFPCLLHFTILTFSGTWLGIAELWGISHHHEIPLVVFSTNTITGATFSQVSI